jgi:isocitrate dehydrogenase (NAD+)
MMLEHIGEENRADRIRQAVYYTLENKSVCTPDIGGTGSTTTFTEAVVKNLKK